MAKKKVEEAFLELPVSFGQLSVGDKTCRIGIAVDRGERFTVTQADKSLCEKRLSAKLVAKPVGNAPDQESLPGMDDDLVFNGVGDVKGFSVTGDTISFGMTFAIKSVAVENLAHFAKRQGKLVVFGIEALPESEEDADFPEE